jgi:hypothetical protein
MVYVEHALILIVAAYSATGAVEVHCTLTIRGVATYWAATFHPGSLHEWYPLVYVFQCKRTYLTLFQI